MELIVIGAGPAYTRPQRCHWASYLVRVGGAGGAGGGTAGGGGHSGAGGAALLLDLGQGSLFEPGVHDRNRAS